MELPASFTMCRQQLLLTCFRTLRDCLSLVVMHNMVLLTRGLMLQHSTVLQVLQAEEAAKAEAQRAADVQAQQQAEALRVKEVHPARAVLGSALQRCTLMWRSAELCCVAVPCSRMKLCCTVLCSAVFLTVQCAVLVLVLELRVYMQFVTVCAGAGTHSCRAGCQAKGRG